MHRQENGKASMRPMVPRRFGKLRSCVGAMAGLIVVATMTAACSSASSGGAASTTATPSAATSAPATSAATLQIGFASSQTGTTAFPAVTQAASAAAAYLNAHGGIDGRHVSLVTCDLKNDEQSAQECGQKFANDSEMPFAIVGLNLGGGSFYSAMQAAGKPVLGALAATPADSAAKDTYFYYTGGNAYYLAIANYIASLHPKTVSIIYDSDASTVPGAELAEKQLKADGLTYKATEIPDADANVTPQIAVSDAGSADVVWLDSVQCQEIGEAFHNLGIKPKLVLSGASCPTAAEIAQNQSYYDGWILPEDSQLASASGPASAAVSLFHSAWSQYGPGGTPGPFAEIGWGIVMTAAQVLTGAGTLNSTAISQLIAGYKGPVVLGGSSISCPGLSVSPTTCGKQLVYYQVSKGAIIPASS